MKTYTHKTKHLAQLDTKVEPLVHICAWHKGGGQGVPILQRPCCITL